MSVKASEINKPSVEKEAQPAAQPRRQRHATALVNESQAATLFVFFARFAGVALLLATLVGTYYGMTGSAAPRNPIDALRGMGNSLGMLGMAVGAQVVLSLCQWGGRAMAKRDGRYWLIYAVSLLVSVYLSWRGYGPTLTAAGVPWLVACGIIILFDVLPETILLGD